MHYQKYDIFYDLEETRGIWRPESDFRGTHRDSSRDSPGKTGTEGIHAHVHIRCSKLCGVLQVGPTRAASWPARLSVIGR
jgi:hypothetical protein